MSLNPVTTTSTSMTSHGDFSSPSLAFQYMVQRRRTMQACSTHGVCLSAEETEAQATSPVDLSSNHVAQEDDFQSPGSRKDILFKTRSSR